MNKLLCIAIATILLSITMVIPTDSSTVAEPISVAETTTEFIETTTEPQPQTKTMLVEATAYCPCVKCCGKWSDGITASGVKAVEGITIAADIRKLPMGTKVYIEGLGERIVQDTGGAIKGNRIDIYFDSHEDALKWGRQQIEIEVLL
jgi:3D (Asp-Asp-Asp) domain-containing protein